VNKRQPHIKMILDGLCNRRYGFIADSRPIGDTVIGTRFFNLSHKAAKQCEGNYSGAKLLVRRNFSSFQNMKEKRRDGLVQCFPNLGKLPKI
jgi:hypothetical protein